MLNTLFLQIVNLSLTGSVVILAVLAVRLLLKRAPKVYSYALWGVVLFRLLCPFTVESAFSLLPAREAPLPVAAQQGALPGEALLPMDYYPLPQGAPPTQPRIPAPGPAAPVPIPSADPLELWVTAGSVLWVVGLVVLLLYSLGTLLRLRATLRDAVPAGGKLYRSHRIQTAFVLGVLRPRIYLPAALTREEERYILLHEETHLRRLDHLTKLLGFAALCLHWFNPLVWAAFFVSGKDMEMACDEAVIGRLGDEVKKEYSSALLSLATGRWLVGGTPLAFGEGDTRGRVKNVLNFKKPRIWVSALVVVIVICAAVGLALNPVEKADPTLIEFPPHWVEGNLGLQDSAPFGIQLDLPKGWEVRPVDETNPNGVAYFGDNFLDELHLYSGDTFVAQVGFQVFQPYEGEIPQAEYYKSVYPQLRLGRFYTWDPYTPVATADGFETALATVGYLPPEEVEQHLGELAAVAETEVPGILAYDKGRGVYVGIQFAPDAVSHEQAKAIARSLVFTDGEALTGGVDYAQTLWQYRTQYLGDNSAVGNLVSNLEFPQGVTCDGIELHTGDKPYTLTINLKADAEARTRYAQVLGAEPFQENACILFALIENLEYVTFRLDDGVQEPYTIQYDIYWAQRLLTRRPWYSSKTLESFTAQMAKIEERVRLANEQARAIQAPWDGSTTVFVDDEDLPLEVLGEAVAHAWLQSFMTEGVSPMERLAGYRIESVSVGPPMYRGYPYDHTITLLYSVTSAGPEYYSYRRGVEGQGTFGRYQDFLGFSPLEGGGFRVEETGPGGRIISLGAKDSKGMYEAMNDMIRRYQEGGDAIPQTGDGRFQPLPAGAFPTKPKVLLVLPSGNEMLAALRIDVDAGTHTMVLYPARFVDADHPEGKWEITHVLFEPVQA